jgi:maltose O-acetyltransferase
LKPYNIGHSSKKVIIKFKERLKIGKGSTYNDNCWFNARYGINIGENTLIGPNVLIHTANHVIKGVKTEQNANDNNSWCGKNPNKRISGEGVYIGNDVWIGAGVIILAGVVIPDKCVIGAGTILTKSKAKILKKGDIVVNDVDIKIIGNRRYYE